MERKSGRKIRYILTGEVRQDTLECVLEYMEQKYETKYASGLRDKAYFIQDVLEELLSAVNYKIKGGKSGQPTTSK